jgi:hypothetical protein
MVENFSQPPIPVMTQVKTLVERQFVRLWKVIEVHRLYFQFFFYDVRDVLLTVLDFDRILFTQMNYSIHVTKIALTNSILNEFCKLRFRHKLYRIGRVFWQV